MAPCSPFLITTNAAPVGARLVPGQDQVLLAGEQLGLAVVEHQAVHPLEQFQQLRPLVENLIVHRVGDDQDARPGTGRGPAVATAASRWPGTDTGSGDTTRAAPVAVGPTRSDGLERFPVVHVAQILAPPAERLATRDHFQPGGVDLPLLGAASVCSAGQSSPTAPTSRTGVK